MNSLIKIVRKDRLIQAILKLIIALCFSVSFVKYINKDIFSIYLIVTVIIVFSWLLFYKITNIKKVIVSFIYSSIFSICLIIGKSISNSNSISQLFSNFHNFLVFIFCVISLSIVFTTLIDFILNKCNLKNDYVFVINKKRFVLIWLIILICWIPCYISYFPGTFNYDIVGQTAQALGQIPYTQWHTPLHTFFWQLCIDFGRLTSIHPAFIYSIIQMLIFSYSMAVCIAFLIRRRTNKYIVIGSLCFFALNPTFALFSFNATKDTLSAAFFLLMIIRGLECYLYDNKKISFVLDTILTSLFRHNVFYAVLLSFIAILIINRKKYKQILILTAVSLVLLVIINGPIFGMLNIKKDNTQESLSVPMQQIANYVYKYEQELTDDERVSINAYLPFYYITGDSAQFNPRHSDYMKFVFNTKHYEENRLEFWSNWIKLFLRHPITYIDSFLCLNLQYWYQDAKLPDGTVDRFYIATKTREDMKVDNFDFTQKNYLPTINQFYELFANYKIQPNLPVIPDIFSLSLPMWLIGLALVKMIMIKSNNYLVLLAPIGLWVTLMGAPISITRYILPLFLLYPLIVSMIIHPSLLNKE